MTTRFIILLLIVTALDICAVSLAKQYSIRRSKWVLLASMSCFVLSVLTIIQLMAYAVTAIVNLLWVTISTVVLILIGHFFFREKLNRWQLLGVLLVLSGMALLSVEI